MSETDKKVSILPEVPKSIDNAIENLTDLPTKAIGQTLSDCWYLIFSAISQSADKKRIKYAVELENFKNEVQTSVSSVPESIRKQPSSQIVLSTLENAKYCVEEKDIRDLFTTLLTSSVDSTKIVHPSFPYIISKMSPIDAQMMKYLVRQTYFPICDIYRKTSNEGTVDIITENIFVDGPENISVSEKTLSISALLSLGLIEIPQDFYYDDTESCSKFYESEPYISLLRKYTKQELNLNIKIVRLSSIGKSFASCCITNRVYGTIN